MTTASSKFYLGLDSSTQGIKAAVISSDLGIVTEAGVNYDSDLPQYKTDGGVHVGMEGAVTQPTVMWIDALDMLMGKLQDSGVDFGSIAAVSGSGQQHGSVYWKHGAEATLGSLAPGASLASQLKDSFSIPNSPNWMDSSTSAECATLEKALGGPETTADALGSRAYERFTGNQIAKLAASTGFAETERISLVSSAMCSIFTGKHCTIDISDGAGMNLMDLRSKEWHAEACEALSAPPALLGPSPVAAHTIAGPVSPYFVGEYGFSSACKSVTWSGDNPCSVAGMRLESAGDGCISLGTSDTIFALLGEPSPKIEGHVFGSPVDPDGYMSLICFTNGSLVRESVMKKTAGDWDKFGAMLGETQPGNGGVTAFHYTHPEITPHVASAITVLFDGSGGEVTELAAAQEARAVVEARFLSMRLHAEVIGLEMKKIFATGGASQNAAITQVMADVFGADVYTMPSPGGAAVGAAYRALHADACDSAGSYISFGESLRAAEGPDAAPHVALASSADPAATAVYDAMLPKFAKLEAQVAAKASASANI